MPSAIIQVDLPVNVFISSMYDTWFKLISSDEEICQMLLYWEESGTLNASEGCDPCCSKVKAFPTVPFNLDLKMDDAYSRNFTIATCFELDLVYFL